MEKFITDERTGLRYELVGDYYLIAGEDEPEGRPIGVWGQRHLRYLKQHRKVLYSELLISGKLNDYPADLNEQAEELFSRLVKQLAEKGNHTFRQKVCKICGMPFWPSNGQEVLCSEECKAINRRQKQLAYYHRKQSEQKAGEAI